MILYHVTPTENIPSIKDNGLIPQIGPLSEMADEKIPRIYFFNDLATVEDAVMNWLGNHLEDVYGEDTELTLITLNIPDNISLVRYFISPSDFEITSQACIPAKYITSYRSI